jgi:hypothetical protein
MPFSIVDSAPGCVSTDAADDTIAPYADCTDFGTFGPAYTFNAEAPNGTFGDVSAGTLIVVALGFVVFILALVAWVRLESAKLYGQVARLRAAAAGAPVPPPGLTAPDAGMTPENQGGGGP